MLQYHFHCFHLRVSLICFVFSDSNVVERKLINKFLLQHNLIHHQCSLHAQPILFWKSFLNSEQSNLFQFFWHYIFFLTFSKRSRYILKVSSPKDCQGKTQFQLLQQLICWKKFSINVNQFLCVFESGVWLSVMILSLGMSVQLV